MLPETFFVVSIDFETQSACDLRKRGAYVYAEHPSTSVLCLTIHDYSTGRCYFWTPTQRNLSMPEGFDYEHGIDFLRDMVTDPRGCVLLAHNHSFEHAIWTRTLKLPEPAAWLDSMDKCLSLGLPGSLDKAGHYLFGIGKDEAGQKLAAAIWGPDKKGRLPPVFDMQIQGIISYNIRDVYLQDRIVGEYGLFMEPAWEEEVRQLHGRINRGGIRIDQKFARQLRDWDEVFKDAAAKEVHELTGGLIQRKDLTRREYIKDALNEQLPPHLKLENMQLGTLEDLLEEDDLDADVAKVVENYLVFSRAALSKVDAALNCVTGDGRAYAQLRYWGAHPGRWSGSQIQIQNLKRPHEDFDLDAATAAVERGDLDTFKALCVDTKGKQMAPYDLLGSLIRGIIVPQQGCSFVISDFAQIEARGLLWLANDMDGLEEHREVDRRGSDCYCALATSMFGYEVTKKHKKERGGGKVGVLACLGPATLVLTQRGVVPITQVTHEDRVWDGVEWSATEGVVDRGVREVGAWNGLVGTPDHFVLVPGDAQRGTASHWITMRSLPGFQRLGRSEQVYDLANCGPRHRFMIVTDAGPVIVHNCGYQGGENAVLRMADGMGIDLKAAGIDPMFVVNGFRNKYTKVVRFWRECENAFRLALTSSRHDSFDIEGSQGGLRFVRLGPAVRAHGDRATVRLVLPSGRYITYANARLIDDPRGSVDKQVLAYDVAVHGTAMTRTTYGGKICENITQAFCRDLIADAMLRTDADGWDIAFHVHDEEICEVPDDVAQQCADAVGAIMHTNPAWAPGMFCATKPEIAKRYKK